ncbi:MAG: zf-TFIIB domain-containing protein [Deltaproteobacteria bacterium]|nr:zf-TFIIB domain-containing protein [Deltaproteobacteria bacterium]
MPADKNPTEEGYFAKLEAEERAKAQVALADERARAARAELKARHAGRCGKCGGAMRPRDFKGVEIDVCDDCGAVLLDPGELETLAGKDASGAISGLAALFKFKGK